MHQLTMKEYQIGIYEKAFPEQYSIGEMLTIGKEIGYDFFEISIDRTEKRISRLFDTSYWMSLKQDIDAVKFPIGSMCLSALSTYTLGSNDALIEKRALEIAFQAILFAENFGLRIVQIPACDVPKNAEHTKETDERFIHNLKKTVAFASAHSVMIGLENMEDHYMDSIEKNMRLIKAIHSPYFLLYSDSGNITSASKIAGTEIWSDMKMGLDRYCAFHLKETRPNKYGGLFYGEGHVDFPAIVNLAWSELGIRRFVLEYWYTGNEEWKKDLAVALALCRNWISQAQIEGKTNA